MVAHLDEDALLGVADLQKGHHKTGFSLSRDNQEKGTFEGQIGKISQVIDVIRMRDDIIVKPLGYHHAPDVRKAMI